MPNIQNNQAQNPTIQNPQNQQPHNQAGQPQNQNTQPNQTQGNAQNPPAQNQGTTQPQDLTTGDVYITEKNLEEILKKLNQNLGDQALKDIIEAQKEALEKLQEQFDETIKDKNDKIAELEKELQDLLLQQPINPQDPTIGATLVELKKQLEALRQEAALEAIEQDQIKADLQANAQEDSITKQALQTEIQEIKNKLHGLENGLDPDFILNDILKDPVKAQEIIKEILKNPHNFPPFNLNPLVDANSDIFAQVRETLNTSRELLRLLATLDYVNNHFQDDVKKYKEELEKALQEILNKRDEALKQFEELIKALENEVKDIKIVIQLLSQERQHYELLKQDMDYLYKEVEAFYILCDDYANYCLNIKNDCITLRDDMQNIELDIEALKEETRNYHDRVEFLHDSIMNADIDKLVAELNRIEGIIQTLGEAKKQEVLEAIAVFSAQKGTELKELFLEFSAKLEGEYKGYHGELKDFCDEIIELIDDKKLDSLDQINITTLSSLASIQSAKLIALDLIKFSVDDLIEEMTQHKADYLVEIQDAKTDSINAINESFAGAGKNFIAEMARINNEILALKGETIAFGKDFKTIHITQTQTWTATDKKRNYFVFLCGASGHDGNNTAGEPTSFGGIKTVAGGAGGGAGRGASGEVAFLSCILEPDTEINVTIGTGRTNGFVTISYAE